MINPELLRRARKAYSELADILVEEYREEEIEDKTTCKVIEYYINYLNDYIVRAWNEQEKQILKNGIKLDAMMPISVNQFTNNGRKIRRPKQATDLKLLENEAERKSKAEEENSIIPHSSKHLLFHSSIPEGILNNIQKKAFEELIFNEKLLNKYEKYKYTTKSDEEEISNEK